MPRVAAIMREDLARGFALAGVDVTSIADDRQAQAAVLAAVDSLGYGMLIIEEELLAKLEPRVRDAILARTVPLVIAIPGDLTWTEPEGASADDYVAAMIRRAVGYQLNITF